jgi:hypothetical protein
MSRGPRPRCDLQTDPLGHHSTTRADTSRTDNGTSVGLAISEQTARPTAVDVDQHCAVDVPAAQREVDPSTVTVRISGQGRATGR